MAKHGKHQTKGKKGMGKGGMMHKRKEMEKMHKKGKG